MTGSSPSTSTKHIMGEYADMAIDEMLSIDFYELTHPEEFDSEIDGVFYVRRRTGRKIPACKYCGKQNLVWKKVEETWRLHEVVPNKSRKPFGAPYRLEVHTCGFKGKFRGNR